MLCSKLHYQKGFKLKPFFYKISARVRHREQGMLTSASWAEACPDPKAGKHPLFSLVSSGW